MRDKPRAKIKRQLTQSYRSTQNHFQLNYNKKNLSLSRRFHKVRRLLIIVKTIISVSMSNKSLKSLEETDKTGLPHFNSKRKLLIVYVMEEQVLPST